MATSTSASFLSFLSHSSTQSCVRGCSPSRLTATDIVGTQLVGYSPKRIKTLRTPTKVSAVAATAMEEVKVYTLPKWTEFELGLAPVYWKTSDGLPPASGGNVTLFYNPINKLVPNDEFGIGFNGGFNQPIMCGGEPRVMTKKVRGKADSPLFTIKICVPKHGTLILVDSCRGTSVDLVATQLKNGKNILVSKPTHISSITEEFLPMNLIFSFTNGVDWDGPYKLQFRVQRNWRNRSLNFFNLGLAEELSKEGACDKAIFPDSNMVINRCAIMGNLTLEGGDRCNLDLVPGCTDPSSPLFNPLANVDDGSCPLESDSED